MEKKSKKIKTYISLFMQDAFHAIYVLKHLTWQWKLNQWLQSKLKQYVPETKVFWQL
jgi:hypothetical protein